MARPKGFEPLTPRFVVWCSIQLSYGRAGGVDIGAAPSPRKPRLHPTQERIRALRSDSAARGGGVAAVPGDE